MASNKEQFEVPAKSKSWAYALIGIGVLALILGFLTKTDTEEHKAVFWATLMYNSIFFTLITNASMFFICATTLAMGGWQIVFRRVPEAISTLVPIFGTITFVILMYYGFC